MQQILIDFLTQFVQCTKPNHQVKLTHICYFKNNNTVRRQQNDGSNGLAFEILQRTIRGKKRKKITNKKYTGDIYKIMRQLILRNPVTQTGEDKPSIVPTLQDFGLYTGVWQQCSQENRKSQVFSGKHGRLLWYLKFIVGKGLSLRYTGLKVGVKMHMWTQTY